MEEQENKKKASGLQVVMDDSILPTHARMVDNNNVMAVPFTLTKQGVCLSKKQSFPDKQAAIC